MSNSRPGVYDPGAVSGGVDEADIALQWALAVRFIAAIEFPGVHVVLTRDDAEDKTPLSARVPARNEAFDAFISLHCNSASVLAHGTETFVADNAGVPCHRLAAKVQQAALAALGARDRGVKPESASARKRLAVLRGHVHTPSCLIELGFITNPGDRKKLLNRDNRIAFARQLLSALTKG